MLFVECGCYSVSAVVADATTANGAGKELCFNFKLIAFGMHLIKMGRNA